SNSNKFLSRVLGNGFVLTAVQKIPETFVETAAIKSLPLKVEPALNAGPLMKVLRSSAATAAINYSKQFLLQGLQV
ncbi:MAG: hypothetical protein IJU92_02725, partial [Spirochaetaceae bacterium]|nr:hypothetical protein [Spirochaetaceae bacterium]